MEVIAVMWWWGPEDHMGAAGWVGMVFMVLFWIAVIIGLIYLIRYLVVRSSADRPQQPTEWPQGGGGTPAGEKRSTPLQILEERYARGEIDREEFLQRRNDLLGRSG